MTDKWGLKQRYSFSDFLYYTLVMGVPLVTALVAVLERSVVGAIIFLILFALAVPVALRFFCTHCPHYCRDEKRLKCIFFWEFPKFFSPRPGPLSSMEKVVCVAGSAVVLVYPVYWLVQAPGLFIVYLMSLVVFGASVRRNECPRCIYRDCPVNIAPGPGDNCS